MTARSFIFGTSLTGAERRALAWAVSRAAQNSCLLTCGMTGIESAKFLREYQRKVKLARQAMRKINELWRQGL